MNHGEQAKAGRSLETCFAFLKTLQLQMQMQIQIQIEIEMNIQIQMQLHYKSKIYLQTY